MDMKVFGCKEKFGNMSHKEGMEESDFLLSFSPDLGGTKLRMTVCVAMPAGSTTDAVCRSPVGWWQAGGWPDPELSVRGFPEEKDP